MIHTQTCDVHVKTPKINIEADIDVARRKDVATNPQIRAAGDSGVEVKEMPAESAVRTRIEDAISAEVKADNDVQD